MAKEFKQFFDANYNNKLKLNSNRISLSQINKPIKNFNSNDDIKNKKSIYHYFYILQYNVLDSWSHNVQ